MGVRQRVEIPNIGWGWRYGAWITYFNGESWCWIWYPRPMAEFGRSVEAG
jgi:hypothetical protein